MSTTTEEIRKLLKQQREAEQKRHDELLAELRRSRGAGEQPITAAGAKAAITKGYDEADKRAAKAETRREQRRARKGK